MTQSSIKNTIHLVDFINAIEDSNVMVEVLCEYSRQYIPDKKYMVVNEKNFKKVNVFFENNCTSFNGFKIISKFSAIGQLVTNALIDLEMI